MPLMTPLLSSGGSPIAPSRKRTLYNLSLCLRMRGRWHLYKQYSSTTFHPPNWPISSTISSVCNLKSELASTSSRVPSDMSMIFTTLLATVSYTLRHPRLFFQRPRCLLLGLNWLAGSNDAREPGGFRSEVNPLS